MEQPIADSIIDGQKQRSKNFKHLKQFALAFISLGLLILSWWLIKGALFGDLGSDYWAYSITATIFWIAAVSFYALINPDRISFFTFNALGLVAFLLIMPRDVFIFAGGVIFFLMSMWFQRRIQNEAKSQLNFSFRRTLGNSQVVMTYALLILIGFMIYSNVRSDFTKDPKQFYRRLSETAVKGIPFFSQDKFNLSQTLENYLVKQAQEDYPEYNQATPEQKQQIRDQIKESFAKQFGIQADQNASLRVVMTEVVAQRLNESLGKYEKFFPLLFTILVIALLRTFSFVFNWVALLISWVLYKILLGFRFFKIEKTTVEVEKLAI
jgi:hypothetical protein